MALYKTVRPAQLYTKIRTPKGTTQTGEVVEVGFFWQDGTLVGLGKVLSENYLNYYIGEVDLEPYTGEDEPPQTDPNDVMEHVVGGVVVERYERIIE